MLCNTQHAVGNGTTFTLNQVSKQCLCKGGELRNKWKDNPPPIPRSPEEELLSLLVFKLLVIEGERNNTFSLQFHCQYFLWSLKSPVEREREEVSARHLYLWGR